MFSNYNYKKLTWMQIGGKLRNNSRRTDFVENSDTDSKFDQLEEAAISIDINFDIDLAFEAIQQGKDLTDVLEAAQVEFCCG